MQDARERWTAAGVFAFLTIVFTYPLSIHPATVLLDDQPDFHLFVWTLGWTAHALVSNPLGILDANIFYPLRMTFAFSENLLGSGLLVAPLIWITGNAVLAVNVVSLTSVLLCGLGAFVLARRLGLTVAAAYVCGIVFAFSPPRFFRLGQLHLTAVQWMPFAMASLHAYLDGGRPRDLKLAIGFFTLQALASGHGGVFLAVSMAALLVYRSILDRRLGLAQRVKDFGWSGALLLAPALLVAIPYRLVQESIGRGRFLDNWTVPAVSFIASPSTVHQQIISLFVPVSSVNGVAHAFLFPGYLPLLLGGAALGFGVAAWRRNHRPRHTLFYAMLATFTVLLTVGPPFGLWPLVYWLPGFNFIRVPSRFLILTVMALAVLSGIAFDRMAKPLSNGARHLWAIVLIVLLLAEFSTIPLGTVPFTTRPPAAERWLAAQPKPFVVAEVPVSGAMRDHSTYMVHSMAHWQPTVHGFSGFDPPEHMRLYGEMRLFPSPESLARLREFGVTHVIVHIDRYEPERWATVASELAAVAELELVFQEMRSRVYRFRDPARR